MWWPKSNRRFPRNKVKTLVSSSKAFPRNKVKISQLCQKVQTFTPTSDDSEKFFKIKLKNLNQRLSAFCNFLWNLLFDLCRHKRFLQILQKNSSLGLNFFRPAWLKLRCSESKTWIITKTFRAPTHLKLSSIQPYQKLSRSSFLFFSIVLCPLVTFYWLARWVQQVYQ